MFCPKCGNQDNEAVNYCRKCGTSWENALLESVQQNAIGGSGAGRVFSSTQSKDPEELTAGGIANVIVGDGFFMVAVILSATHSPVSSLLWLFLLIPAFFCFGKGFADVLHASQIRRRLKQSELQAGFATAGMLPPQDSVI